MKYAANPASCIWKALGFVLRLHDTHWLCKILYRWTLKNWPQRGFQHGGAGRPHWKNRGAWVPPPPAPKPMDFSKHLKDWLGVSTVELCGQKKRDLGGILRYVQAQKWGAGDLLLPPPGKWGRGEPLPPLLFLPLWTEPPRIGRYIFSYCWLTLRLSFSYSIPSTSSETETVTNPGWSTTWVPFICPPCMQRNERMLHACACRPGLRSEGFLTLSADPANRNPGCRNKVRS